MTYSTLIIYNYQKVHPPSELDNLLANKKQIWELSIL